MTITLDQFLAGLSELVSGVQNVVVATYNNLTTHKNGGEFNAGGRKISILCGGAFYAYVETAMGYVPNDGAQETKIAGVKKISDGLAQVASNSFVILYAGTSQFNEVVQLAYQLDNQNVKVALVSCGCNKEIFDGLELNKNVLLVIPTHGHCNGGRNDLSMVVAQLLN